MEIVVSACSRAGIDFWGILLSAGSDMVHIPLSSVSQIIRKEHKLRFVSEIINEPSTWTNLII